jgi:hypothetical protein
VAQRQLHQLSEHEGQGEKWSVGQMGHSPCALSVPYNHLANKTKC